MPTPIRHFGREVVAEIQVLELKDLLPFRPLSIGEKGGGEDAFPRGCCQRLRKWCEIRELEGLP
jgi:hypothetical protein